MISVCGRAWLRSGPISSLMNSSENSMMAYFHSSLVATILPLSPGVSTPSASAPRVVMFNLGWLPGAEHIVTTKTETTLTAVQAAIELIVQGGFVSICVYPGHEEGTKELRALLDWAGKLSVREYNVLHHAFINAREGTPELILIQKN